MDTSVKKQLMTVCALNAALTAVENVVFLVIGKWDMTVLAGSAWGWLVTSVYFLMICISIPSAILQGDPEIAKRKVQASYYLRMAVIAAGIIRAIKAPFMNYVAALIPLLFTRISITLINLRQGGK